MKGTMIVRRTSRVALALLIAGCSSIFGSEGPEVSIGLRTDGASVPIARFEVDIGGRHFGLQPREGESSRDVRAPDTGTLPVRARLLATGSDTLANLEFTQTFREGSDHWVVAWVGLERPLGHCIGRLIVTPLPPNTEAAPDTLFLMHGSIPEGAVC